MKILEVKNNLVKISYTAKDNLVISGFVIIEDSQYPYVAQVMSLKADSGVNYAIVKLLFTFNQEGVVKNYNGTVPELDAIITPLASNELLDILPIEKPLTIGKLAQQKFVLNVDYSILEKNLVVCSDNTENTDILLSNFAKQITDNNNKSVIFDTDGTINAENRLVFGEDFKLPLNYDSINFIYENDLNDVEPASKAFIQDIFLEVQEYSKTVLDQFIPFDTFISVVDAQYKELEIPELVLLKNRLLKYKENNVFAQSAKEFQSIRATIRANLSTLLDISSAEPELQKLIINYVYNEIEDLGLYVYSLTKINSENADKKLIRRFLSEDKIYTTIVCPHNYKYLYELKERANNLILFTPQTMQHDFASYNIFLNKLNQDECVIYGKSTQNIPLILEIMPLEDIDAAIKAEDDLSSGVNAEDDTVEKVQEKDDFSEDSNSYSQESMLHDETIARDEAPSNSVEEQSQDDVEQDSLQTEEDESEVILQKETIQADAEDIKQTEQQEVSELEPEQETLVEAEPETEPELNAVNQNVEQTPIAEQTEIIPEVESEAVEMPSLSGEDLLKELELSQENPPEVAEAQIKEEQGENLNLTDTLEELHIEDESSEFIDLPQVDQENLQPFEEPEPVSEELSDIDSELAVSSAGLTQADFIEDNSTDNEELEDIPQELSSPQDTDVSMPQSSEELNDNLTLDDLDYITDVNLPSEPQTMQNFGFSEEMLQSLEDDTPKVREEETLTDYESLLSDAPLSNDNKPPVVPIYPAETTPVNTQKDFFEPGDRVSHPKYGEGVVEKMIKYGNKVLCSINFANGRRLLDPTISQLQKV